MTTTVPKSPKFQQTKSKPLNRDYINEGPKPKEMDKFEKALLKLNTAAKRDGGDGSIVPAKTSSTKGLELAMENNRKNIEKKLKDQEQKEKEDKARKDI